MVPIIPAAAGIATDEPSPKNARQTFNEATFWPSAIVLYGDIGSSLTGIKVDKVLERIKRIIP